MKRFWVVFILRISFILGGVGAYFLGDFLMGFSDKDPLLGCIGCLIYPYALLFPVIAVTPHSPILEMVVDRKSTDIGRKANPEKNYTEPMVKRMTREYKANPTRDTVEILATDFDKSVGSVIAKLRHLGVYQSNKTKTIKSNIGVQNAARKLNQSLQENIIPPSIRPKKPSPVKREVKQESAWKSGYECSHCNSRYGLSIKCSRSGCYSRINRICRSCADKHKNYYGRGKPNWYVCKGPNMYRCYRCAGGGGHDS